ncbi:MAG: phosphonate metabolism transcriptional regulator PhnF [Pseudomonadota bacterium]|nr:phosphonate metabolism transcriptional regulator PhnF [Pseudomonadota bacterium]
MTRSVVGWRAGGRAVYTQIAEMLEREIRERYEPGQMLPSEAELAERFGVNRHTVRRAVEALIGPGLVERVHGKGTVVLNPAIDYAIGSATRFTETLHSQGRSTASRVFRKLVIPAVGGVARRLNLEDGTAVLFIETLREVEGQPFCIISHFLPASRFSEVKDHYEQGSLHGFLKEHYALSLRRTESLISAVLPERDDALRLRMARNAPVLRVKSLNVDTATGEPVEYAVTRFRGDAAQLSIRP